MVYGTDDLAPLDLVRIFCFYLKVRIKTERVRLSSDFTERLVSVARVCHVSDARLEWYLEVP